MTLLAEPKFHPSMHLAEDHPASPEPYRWTREQYARMAEEGWFEGRRVQLIEGEIITMPPMNPAHAVTIGNVVDLLGDVFGKAHAIRSQMPLNISGNSDPEPDIAVCEHPHKFYDKEHPTTALLIVEVSNTSLRLDRRKAGLYASAGIPEYWIIDLNSRRVEVYRQPMADEAAEFGWRYGQMRILEESDTLDLPTHPDANIQVRDLLA